MIKVVNTLTGEVEEFLDDTPKDILNSWKLISNQIKALERAKEKLKKKVPAIVDNNGNFEHSGYRFHISTVQRFNYDKAIMREVFDEDLLDTLLVPNKTLVDTYIKDNLEDLGENSTYLRKNMVEQGLSYQVIKLEKTERTDMFEPGNPDYHQPPWEEDLIITPVKDSEDVPF